MRMIDECNNCVRDCTYRMRDGNSDFIGCRHPLQRRFAKERDEDLTALQRDHEQQREHMQYLIDCMDCPDRKDGCVGCSFADCLKAIITTALGQKENT